MCNFLSLIVTRDGRVHGYPCVDSHADVLRRAGISDTGSEFRPPPFAKIEIQPMAGAPVDQWKFVVDECTEPEWLTAEHRRACYEEAKRIVAAELLGVETVRDDGSWSMTYRRDGKFHRDGGPAYTRVNADGSWGQEYYRDGKDHRDGGPAVTWVNADGGWGQEYYRDGKPHRDGGPAVTWVNADGGWEQRYYRDGEFHREGGPAVTWVNADGSWEQEYHRDGKLHRDGGPAVTRVDADGGWGQE